MIRRPPRSTQSRSSAASDVYKRQLMSNEFIAAVERVGSLFHEGRLWFSTAAKALHDDTELPADLVDRAQVRRYGTRLTIRLCSCLLYTSDAADAADDLLCVDLGGRRIIK